ncbi:MAG: hypothetical protein JWM71_1564 [Solirubrobacteraceae bacterium]|nr:hypothetical protein [Solirubrobacteraceae bacterium]
MATDPVYRRRRLAALGGALVIVAVIVALTTLGGGGGSSGPAGADAAKPKPPPQLPRGGRVIFPHYEVVAYYGAPQDPQLGELGIGSPQVAGRRLERQARPYARGGRPVLPAMELLADIAQYAPGDDGLYRLRQPDFIIRRYLRAARRIKALLILDIQPGHAGFLQESEHLAKWLKLPDVSLALDPEWDTPGAIPGKVIGSVDVHEVNAVSFWLDRLTVANRLPQKLLVVHRFTPNMIVGEADLKPRAHVAVTLNVDGFGANDVKLSKYHEFAKHTPGLHNGFKLFYHEDPHTMKPHSVLRIRPRPELVVYE